MKRLFDQEARSLREEGEAFAKDFPEAGRFLGLDSNQVEDPYVDRLIEGAAFLTGRIREALATEFDGLTRTLEEVVAPGIDRALPSVAVVRFAPRSDFAEPTLLPMGAAIEGSSGSIRCRFRLCHDLELEQVAIRSARLERLESGQDVLEIEFAKTSQDKTRPWPAKIPVFLLGDAPVVWALRFALLRRLGSIQVSDGLAWSESHGVKVARLDRPGYSAEGGEPSPFLAIRDFLCSDERFRFLSIEGLERWSGHAGLKIRFHLRGTLPRGSSRSVEAGIFNLHCGVVANEFPEACHAVAWDHTSISVPIRPQGGAHRQILDLREVVGLTAGHPIRRVGYARFSAFRPARGQGRFQLLETVQEGGRRSWEISLSRDPDRLENEYLSVEALCSDGDFPHDHLPASRLSRLAMERPPRVSVEGLTRPTQTYRPHDGADRRSRVLAFAAGHFEGWLDGERLRDAMRHLSWDPSEAKKTLIEAIQEVRTENDHVLDKGVAWRRMTVVVRLRDRTCTPDTWERLGAIDAFGSVLFGLVQEATPIGSRTRMQLVVDPAGVRLDWEN